MSNLVNSIWIILLALGALVAALLARDFVKYRGSLEANSWFKTGATGFIGNFFDTLGIGSFAIETALFKFLKQCEDRLIPGTLNVGNAIPTVAQAVIFIKIIEVDPLTLVLMIAAAGAGAILGAGIVTRLPEKRIRMVMGVALFVAACFMVVTNVSGIKGHGEAIGLMGGTLVLASIVNFILGALMTAGIGLYAPCMALVFALGLSPTVAFPIMMGSCAFLMPIASIKFIREKAYNRRASMAIAMAGTLGVLIAVYLVKSLPMEILRWLVIVVVVYTAILMLRPSRKEF